ncbi:MAG: hypothetical protein A3G83_08200 [Betaproteobacteria bacterium RIFCSPLOWO2_12_FULL_68_20]|nr:MAG: hypothetical protein A3G83_08200 [Betaproteobacteria bacterium RIFCSPLOWO2_12_FULL_68_20]
MEQGVPAAGPGENGAHRLARIDYGVRTAAFAYCFVVIALHVWGRSQGWGFWAALALQFLAYPHLLYLVETRSAHPTRAELNGLYLDSLLLGAWTAELGFPTWIAYALIFSTALNATVNRGGWGALCSLSLSAVGAALWTAIGGYRYWPATGDLVTTLSFFGSLAYTCGVGYVVYGQTRRLAAARDDLHRSEERYRLIAEHAADLIAMVDLRGRWLYTSPSYARMLDPADLEPGADAFRRMHPEDAERARIAVLRGAASERAPELALRLVDREGRIRQLRTRVQFVPANGAPRECVLLVSQDMTDLRESEERLLLAAHALEGMTEAIMITSADGTIATVNRAFTEITGNARDEVLGRPESEFRNALQPPEFYDELYRTVRRDGYWSGTTWSRRRNGSVYREWRSVRAVRDAAGAITHCVSVFYEIGAGSRPTGEAFASP